MKTTAYAIVFGTLTLVAVGRAGAEIIDGINWADDVYSYSANIQNYGGELMTPSTEWWLTGPPDADCNGNGYAWDPGDQDTVAGWRAAMPDEYVTMYWETGIPDLAGEDLVIRLHGGPSAAADVFASVDGGVFGFIGAIGGGTPGYFRDEAFDFAGLFAESVHYVKVLRTTSGPQTGMFFDAFGGNVPEPSSLALMVLAVLAWGHRKT
ncbi:MAG: PEP-CTERM sorting domain-containing protein [Planctomycetota bacterium]